MKFLEKLTEGAGIAVNYAGGIAAIWLGGIATFITLLLWSLLGMSVPLGIFMAAFGLAPAAGGVWLFRRGKVLQQLFKVKLQKEDVRQLAFQHKGCLKPFELAKHHHWDEERALDILKNLAAEDPERIELQLDYESGELSFEFRDIRRALEARAGYNALPISETVGRKAVEIAMMLGKTIDTFQDYVEFTRETVSEHHKQKKEERYRAKIEHFLAEIDALRKE